MNEIKKLSNIITIRAFNSLRYPKSNHDHLAHQLIRKLMQLFVTKVRVFTIMGKAGCGKGTLSGWCIEELNKLLPQGSRYETISLGNYFRNILRLRKDAAHVSAKDRKMYEPFVNLVTDEDLKRMAAGKMISNETVINVITAILKTDPYDKAFGLFIDGFPRNITQAKILQSGKIMWHGKPLVVDLYVHLHIPKKRDALFKMRAQQRVNQEIEKAALEHRLAQIREDDRPEVMEERLLIYYKHTQGAINYIFKHFKDRCFKMEGTCEGEIKDSVVMDRARFLMGWMLQSGYNTDLEDLQDIKEILTYE